MATRLPAVFRLPGASLAAVLATLLAAGSAMAAESAPQTSPRATVTLVSDVDSVAPGRPFRVGLRQRLAPHWHTYWKNPGDAGAAPTVALNLPDGAKAGAIVWPGPDRIPVGPVLNFGYEKEIVLPIAVEVPPGLKEGGRFVVEADANWLVCEKECIPEAGRFRLELPVERAARPATGEVAAAFVATDLRRPEPAPWPTQLTSDAGGLTLRIDSRTLGALRAAVFYPDEWGMIVHAAPQRFDADGNGIRLRMEKGPTFTPAASAGLIALTDAGGRTRWFETRPATGAAASSTAPAASGLPLWRAALFALLGGLILNLMPCVFPVLAIKATSLAKLSGGAARELRLSALFYTLGVLVAFIALALALLAVRAAGAAVGWGFQFQSPLFVAAMSWLLFAIGLNLSGVFEIGGSLAGSGQALAGRSGNAGSFFAGLLAVVVATPCTAPFMGAALGVALAAPAAACLAIFIAMGLGLALPYALFGLQPRLARLLPRPGPWMLNLRQALAFPMYASAAWLLWVLTRQAGEQGLRLALTGVLLIGFLAWLYGALRGSGRSAWPRGVALAGLAGLVALALPLRAVQPQDAVPTSGEQFSAQRLAQLRSAGRPVFVNMTAAWCITCLVNERTTLSSSDVQAAMRKLGVAYLKGDWTRQNPEITAYLQSFQRDGVPFYAFYPADGAEPAVLPSVLTRSIVLEEIQRGQRAAPLALSTSR